MAGDRRATKIEPGKPCRHCQKPTVTLPDGKLAHDRRAPAEPPKEKTEEQVPPKREHLMHRTIGGKSS